MLSAPQVSTPLSDIAQLHAKLHQLEEEQEYLVQLVRKGEGIMQELCEENATLERRLSMASLEAQISMSEAQMVRALSGITRRSTLESQGSDASSIYRHAIDSMSGEKSTDTEAGVELLRALAEERKNAQTYRLEAQALATQASSLQQEVHMLAAEREQIAEALEDASWAKERDRLMQKLGEEMDKTCTWKEEKEELESSLKTAQEEVQKLNGEKHELKQAASQAAWNSERESLKESLTLERTKVSSWEEEKNQLETQLAEASSKCEDLTADNSRLREEVDMVVWKEEKEQLAIALEEEKDKTSTWEEEKTRLEAQIIEVVSDNDALGEENSALRSLVDTAAWQHERQELLNALSVEKGKVKSWEKESNAIRMELKDLRQVAKSLETKDALIAEMQEQVDQLRSDLEDAQAKVAIKQDVIDGLRISLRQGSADDWVIEKVALLARNTEMKLAMSALEEAYAQERSLHISTRVRKEEVELELDKAVKELEMAKADAPSPGKDARRRHVTWGTNQITEIPCRSSSFEYPDDSPLFSKQLSISIIRSRSAFPVELDSLQHGTLKSTSSMPALSDACSMSGTLSVRTKAELGTPAYPLEKALSVRTPREQI
ncbi:unnamed protein product [Ostreobium quekettii]|uniref:Uncharacterized protein n=1 Tax=Ostreobium quekettii TaxID=121088 RepID=A0A8S1IMM5_9CHLO|nr:unnamed protein product [Ostreobium quekettii]